MEKKELYRALKNGPLLHDLTEEELEHLLKSGSCRLRTLPAGARIFDEEDVPQCLFVLVRGTVIVARDTFSGKRMILANITEPGDTFGEVYVFRGVPRYDMYAEVTEQASVLFLDAGFLTGRVPAAFRSTAGKIMRNELSMFAAKAYRMNRRLRILSASGIRGKIARMVLDAQDADGRARVPAREEMADYLSVARPSLSREISRMEKDGILKNEGRTLLVLDQERLEACI